jgi:hypothetical protein
MGELEQPEQPATGAVGRAVGGQPAAVVAQQGGKRRRVEGVPLPRGGRQLDGRRRCRQVAEGVGDDDAERAAPAAGVRPEQVPRPRVAAARGDQPHRPVGVDDHHVDGGQVVDGQAVLARHQLVAPTDDVPAQTHRVAGACGQRHAVALVQQLVDVPVRASALQPDAAVGGPGDRPHPRDVEDHPAGVVGHEALVAVAAGAHGDPPACGDRGEDGLQALVLGGHHDHRRGRAGEPLV